MAKQTINIGTSANKGDGDPIRTAFDKVNDNFDELYSDVAALTGTGNSTVDLQANVFADDSTLLVDAINGSIPAANLTGALPAIDGSALTGISGGGGGLANLVDDTTPQLGGNLDLNNFDITGTGDIPAANLTGTLPALDGSALTGVTASSIAFADVTATPTTLAGYGITDAYTKTEVDNAITSSVLPSGSTQSIDIVAADSTLLVDSVNGIIPGSVIDGPISVPSITGVGGGSTNYLDLYADYLGQVSKDGQKRIFATDTVNDVFEIGTTAPYSEYQPTLKVYGNAQFGSITLTGGSALTGDITGSVYADDSTLLVDGVNGTLNSSALSMPISIPDGTISSNYLGFGDDDDLKIFHNGSSSIITETNLTSSLILRSYQDVRLADAGGTETMLKAISHGAVELYHNNVKKLETTADGVKLGDNGKATFGDDNDLEIHHTGGVNYIAGSAGTVLTGNWLYLRKSGSAENYLICKGDGTVELYYDNVKKLETTTDGVAVTGKITGLTDPTDSQDAATKAYVDANIGSGGGGGSAFTNIGVGADDSTIRSISEGESFLILGGTGITTASDAEGNITITASGGGSGLQSRGTVTGTTSSLADAAEADLDITGFKSYALLAITTDRAARVRLYVSDATRTADASRAEGVDPTSDAGLIAEVITTGADTVIISPGAFGFNLEGTPTTTIPCRVTNKSGGTSTVQVDLNILQLEA